MFVLYTSSNPLTQKKTSDVNANGRQRQKKTSDVNANGRRRQQWLRKTMQMTTQMMIADDDNNDGRWWRRQRQRRYRSAFSSSSSSSSRLRLRQRLFPLWNRDSMSIETRFLYGSFAETQKRNPKWWILLLRATPCDQRCTCSLTLIQAFIFISKGKKIVEAV